MAFTESCHISQTLYVDFFSDDEYLVYVDGWLAAGWFVGCWLAGCWSFVWLVDHWVVK